MNSFFFRKSSVFFISKGIFLTFFLGNGVLFADGFRSEISDAFYYLSLLSVDRTTKEKQERKLESRSNRSETRLLECREQLAKLALIEKQLTGAREERLGIISMVAGATIVSAITYWDQTGADDGKPCLIPGAKILGGGMFLNGFFWFIWGQLTGADITPPVLTPMVAN